MMVRPKQGATAKRAKWIFLAGLSLLDAAMVVQAREKPVEASSVCVTNGVVENRQGRSFEINSPSSRAIVKGANDSRGALRFEYLGPTTKDAPLASGLMRRQLGIKLRAEDSCNVIYVMWSIEPEQGLIITMKMNTGKSTHAECGVKGYKKLEPTMQKAIAPIKIGEPRTLSAELDGSVLKVNVDGERAWEGETLASAAKMYGYTGIRTDNVRIKFDWIADDDTSVSGPRARGRAVPAVSCKPVVR